MENFVYQFMPGLFGTSLSVGIILLLMRLCAGWLNQNLRLMWKKWLYLFLAIRLLIPVNIGIPVIHRAQVGDTVQSQSLSPTDNARKDGAENPVMPGVQTQEHPRVQLYHPIQLQVRQKHLSWIFVCFYIWLTGFGIYIACFAGEYLYCRWKLLRRACPVDEHMQQMVQQIARELGLRRTVRVMCTPETISPMVMGVVRPVLLLPEISYGNNVYYYILKHELVHLKSNDIFYKYVFLLANALHWFNPLVYLLVKYANANLELCCDACVVADTDGDGKKQYVQAIMSAVDGHAVHARFSTEFYGGKEMMMVRFANILKKDERKHGAGVVALFVAATLAGGMLTACTAQKVRDDAESLQPDTESMEPSQMEGKDTEQSQMEEKNTETPDAQVTGQEDGLARFTGLWMIDVARTDATLQESESVYDMFGSGFHLGDELEIRSDGTVRYYIGIGIGGEGTYQIDGDTLTAQITPYEPHGFEGENGLVARYVEEFGTEYLVTNMFDEDFYWGRKVEE